MSGLEDASISEQPEATKTITVTQDMLVSDFDVIVEISKSLPKLKANEYRCENCLGVYEYGWSDEEANAEYAKNFPDHAGAERAIVCDDCYRQMMG